MLLHAPAYLIALTVGLCVSYFVILFLFNTFFIGQPNVETQFKPVRSIILILLFCFLTFVFSSQIQDPDLSNRVLTAAGGGFLSFLICFLVVEDSKITINKRQFFIFSALVVTLMSVGNEILEFLLQTYAHMNFSPNPTDTWLDLASTAVGILIAGVILTPLLNKEN